MGNKAAAGLVACFLLVLASSVAPSWANQGDARALAVLEQPTISGDPSVGAVLRAVVAPSEAASIAYQWNANAAPIGTGADAATKPELIVTPDLLGQTITLTVAVTWSDQTTESATSAPTTAVQPNPWREIPFPLQNTWNGVSCASETACFALVTRAPIPDSGYDQPGDAPMFLVTFDGEEWGEPQPLGNAGYGGLDCAPNGTCLMVVDSGSEPYPYNSKYRTYQNGQWGEFKKMAPLPVDYRASYTNVECLSAKYCLVKFNGHDSSRRYFVEYDPRKRATDPALAERTKTRAAQVRLGKDPKTRWARGTWSFPRSMTPRYHMGDFACGGRLDCIVTDHHMDRNVMRYDGEQVTHRVGGHGALPASLACESKSLCVALTDFENVADRLWDGTAWSKLPSPPTSPRRVWSAVRVWGASRWDGSARCITASRSALRSTWTGGPIPTFGTTSASADWWTAGGSWNASCRSKAESARTAGALSTTGSSACRRTSASSRTARSTKSAPHPSSNRGPSSTRRSAADSSAIASARAWDDYLDDEASDYMTWIPYGASLLRVADVEQATAVRPALRLV